jgi:hypothetical protein
MKVELIPWKNTRNMRNVLFWVAAAKPMDKKERPKTDWKKALKRAYLKSAALYFQRCAQKCAGKKHGA